MIDKNKKIYDIHERIYQWVISIINFTKELPRTQSNLIIIPQLTEAVTSVGANDQEANGSNSKKDFIAKYSIVRKECKETLYWLRVVNDTNPPQFVRKVQLLTDEGREIGNIVSTIMNNAKK